MRDLMVWFFGVGIGISVAVVNGYRASYWEYGYYESLEARRDSKTRVVEIWGVRENPNHSLWVEIHPDHWDKFRLKK